MASRHYRRSARALMTSNADATAEPIPNRCWRRRGSGDTPITKREAQLARARERYSENREVINEKRREQHRIRRLACLEERQYYRARKAMILRLADDVEEGRP